MLCVIKLTNSNLSKTQRELWLIDVPADILMAHTLSDGNVVLGNLSASEISRCTFLGPKAQLEVEMVKQKDET